MKQINSPIFYLTLLVIAIVGQSKLEVSNFAQMRDGLQDNQLKDIPYSIGNFGFAPFGKTMIAPLYSTPSLDNQCNPPQNHTYHKFVQNSFLLIPRGTCPFVTKALHAQEAGAKMAIIMDDQDHEMGVIMKDDGYGYKVTIPAIFINYKYGQKLLQLLNKTQNEVKLKIFFENVKTEKAEINIYLQSFNRLSYYFIDQFKPFYEQIKRQVTLNLVYDTIKCTICDISNDCYNKGEYCSVNYVHKNSSNGRMILDQQLRQQIIFQKHFSQWWDYIHCFSEQCTVITEGQECSDRCSIKSNIDPNVLKKQVKQSFNAFEDNKILANNIEQLRNAGVQSYPSLSINNNRIKGTLNAQFVFDDICNTLIKPPRACNKYIIEQISNITSSNMYWLIIFLVLILSAALFTGLFIIFRRQMKKRMSQQMQGRVDDMVSKYIQFYSERNNRK